MDTTVDTTVPKVVKKRGGPACSDCKSKKKRCAHRGAEGETELASKATLAPAPASAMKTRKHQREGTIKTPASDDAPPSPKKVKIEKTTTKKAIKAKTTATKAKGKGKTTIKADPEVDEEIQTEKKHQPVKRVKRKQAANPSPPDRPAPGPAADDADADVTSTPPVSCFAASEPMPDHPTDALEGTMRMSVHTVWSQKLQTHLAELKADFQAAKEATDAAIASADAVVETVEIWEAIWRKGQ
ncbi:uncharacterized protein N7503_005552 [Penicillium pulvis]|uniref:uncharacterized protein n=1 Tax=Penicillium pulvis TaxID=1562058 RepID=UPI002549521E|nr:uncharacterized protein N7503_005552 [Penicillium pulvis]KAJ5803102.1 hypothetical protein N7503_005552 [Penicillium pulvis]